MFGLNVLRYDVAIHNGQIGCISQKMNKTDEEQLMKIGRYMTSLNQPFLPEDNKTRDQYTFHFVEKTIDHFNLQDHWPIFTSDYPMDA